MNKCMFPTVYPDKIYSTLNRACRYSKVLPNYVQPVFAEFDGLTFERVGFAIGPEKDNQGRYIKYRRLST